MSKKRRKLKKKYRKPAFLLLLLLIIAVIGVKKIFAYSSDQSAETNTEASTSESAASQNAVYETEDQAELEDISFETAVLTDAGTALESEIASISEAYEGQLGFILVNKNSGETIAENASQTFESASLYKLFVAYAVLDAVDDSSLSLETAMDNYDGTVASYMVDMITVSDNVTAKSLATLIGWDTIETFVYDAGFENTSFNPVLEDGVYVNGYLQTTAEDVIDLLNRLYNGTLLSESSSEYFISLLEDQELDYALNSGLADNVAFSHKTGLLDTVSHDAGVITWNDEEYLVAVLSDGWSNATEEATPLFEETGAAIMTYLYAQ